MDNSKSNSLNCVAVLENDTIVIKEIRNLVKGDKVVMGKSRDGQNGVLMYKEGFSKELYEDNGFSVETSFSEEYELLTDLMKGKKKMVAILFGYLVLLLFLTTTQGLH